MKVLNLLLQQIIALFQDYFNNSKFQVEYNGSCLKPDRVSFAPKKTIKLCNTFEIKSWTFHVDNDFRLGKW